MAYWMITVRPPFSRWLVEGKKTMEIRTRIPKDLCIGDFVYVVEAASGGKVIGCFLVGKLIIAHPVFLANPYYSQHRVPFEMFCEYVGSREEVFGICLKLLKKAKVLTNISDFGLSRPPQWFTKIDENKILPF